MKSIKLSFKNKDNQELSAVLELPVDQKPKAYAIFAHCFTCNKNYHGPRNISQGLTSNGFAVLLLDFTGLGQSEGEFHSTTFTTNIEDLISAANFLSKNYETPKIMIGHSLGGMAALYAAHEMKAIKAVVCIASPFKPSHIERLFTKDADEINKSGKAEVNIGGRPFMIGKSFLDDIKKHKTEEIAKSLRRALLIMHSPQDKVVSIDNAAKTYNAAMHPKSFISLDGADHLLQNKEDSIYAGQITASWVTKYIKPNKEDDDTVERGIIAQTNHNNYQTEIRAGTHRLIADEPEEVGGTNIGPSPHQLLSAALAACSTMTMQMYAKRKKWPLETATVQVIYKVVDRLVDEKKVKVERFERRVELKGDLNEEQRKRILEISNRCPVKRTLDSEVEIESSLKS